MPNMIGLARHLREATAAGVKRVRLGKFKASPSNGQIVAMTPAELDARIAARQDDGQHGDHNCPKCALGYMAYAPCGSTSFYSCQKCSWIEFSNPPWPSRRVTSDMREKP